MTRPLRARPALGLGSLRRRLAASARIPSAVLDGSRLAPMGHDPLAALCIDADPSAAIAASLGAGPAGDDGSVHERTRGAHHQSDATSGHQADGTPRADRPQPGSADGMPTAGRAAPGPNVRGSSGAGVAFAGRPTSGPPTDPRRVLLTAIASVRRASPVRVPTLAFPGGAAVLPPAATSGGDRGTEGAVAGQRPVAPVPRPGQRPSGSVISRPRPALGAWSDDADQPGRGRSGFARRGGTGRRTASIPGDRDVRGVDGLAALAHRWAASFDDGAEPVRVDWSEPFGGRPRSESPALSPSAPRSRTGRAGNDAPDDGHRAGSRRGPSPSPRPTEPDEVDAALRLQRSFRGLLEDLLLDEALGDGIEVVP